MAKQYKLKSWLSEIKTKITNHQTNAGHLSGSASCIIA